MNDLSPMPFGKYKDWPMQDVPCEYLHWAWFEFLRDDNGLTPNQKQVRAYIVENINSLQKENEDLIWE